MAKYPLLQVLEIKHKRVEDAEKVVKEKLEALEKEKQKLAEREADRDKAVHHYQEKLTQMREEMDHGTTSPKIQQMKAYLKVTQEKVKIEEKKVQDQKGQVELAEKNVQMAKHELKLRRQEVDKLLTHKKDWEKEMRKEEEIIEGRQQDELGTISFSIHNRKR